MQNTAYDMLISDWSSRRVLCRSLPWKRSLGLCWLSLITHGYRCKFRGAVEPNRICRQPVRTDGKFSCLRQMALLLTVPVNGSPGERAYARAAQSRSVERRVGNECGSKRRFRWLRDTENKK